MQSQIAAAEVPMKDVEKLRVEDDDEKSQSENIVDPEDGISPAKAYDEDDHEGKGAQQSSLELTRTASNALSKVTSRLTNRHIVDPGPPPGTQRSLEVQHRY